MVRRFSQDFKKGFWIAFYEYTIITLPVGIYVTLEALHKRSWPTIFITPEWSIATIFLSFISISRYRSAVEKSGRKIIEPIFGLMALLSLIIIICATINTYISMNEETSGAIIVRIILFILATIKFFLLVTGSKLLNTKAN